MLVKQCVGSVNNNVSLNRVTRVSNQYFEILIELVNTCCFLISVIYDLTVNHRPFPCETRMLAESVMITVTIHHLYQITL